MSNCAICIKELNDDDEIKKCSVCLEPAHESCVKYYISYAQIRLSRAWKCAKCAKSTNSPSVAGAGESNFSLSEYAPMLQAKFLEENLAKTLKGHFDSAVGEIKDTVAGLAKKLVEQNKKIAELEKTKEDMQKQIDTQKTDITNLESRVDELEQDKLALNLEIHGVPEIPGEDLYSVAQDIADTMNASASTEGIADMFRGRKMKNKPAAIVVKFQNSQDRESWLQGRKKEAFKNYTLPATYSQVSSFVPRAKGKKQNDSQNQTNLSVRVYEQLTFLKRQLLYETSVAAKGKFKFVWSRGGKIFARKDENAKALIRIRNRDDIITKIQMNPTAAIPGNNETNGENLNKNGEGTLVREPPLEN